MQKQGQMFVDMKKARTKWGSIVERLGVTDQSKIDTLCEYAEMHSNTIQASGNGMMNENAMYANPANTAGMGAVNFPTMSGIPGMPGAAGSGDLGQTMLPASIKLAAHTIGLELLPMINVNSNRVDMLYYDWAYDDNNGFDNDERASTFKFKPEVVATSDSLNAFLRAQMTAKNVTELRGRLSAPLYFHLSGTGGPGEFAASSAGSYDPTLEPTGTKAGWVQFKGFSRIDGMPMFRIWTQDNAASTGSWGFDVTKNTLPATGNLSAILSDAVIDDPTDTSTASITFGTVSNISLVSLNEDFIEDFTSSRKQGTMTRGEWDVDQASKIGPRSEVKSVEIGVVHVSATLRLSEIGDWKRMYGVDVVEKTKEQLVTQLAQKMSVEVVEKVKGMGMKNRASAPVAIGAQNTALSAAGITDGKMFDFSTTAIAGALGGETSASIVRKLWAKVIQASYFISTDGRIGGADFLVTSGAVAAALKSIDRYAFNPLDAKLAIVGQLQPAGTIDGIKLYVDPYANPNDYSIYLGRKGTKEDPGLKFFAYMLAESVEVTSEKNMAPHLYMYSRYTIAEFGYFPEKQYMAIKVEDNNGLLY